MRCGVNEFTRRDLVLILTLTFILILTTIEGQIQDLELLVPQLVSLQIHPQPTGRDHPE